MADDSAELMLFEFPYELLQSTHHQYLQFTSIISASEQIV